MSNSYFYSEIPNQIEEDRKNERNKKVKNKSKIVNETKNKNKNLSFFVGLLTLFQVVSTLRSSRSLMFFNKLQHRCFPVNFAKFLKTVFL